MRQKLERSEALFEQRKMAAREEIENAEEIEARIDDKTERLIQLSEYVKRKDEEAQEKLDQAEENKRNVEDVDRQRMELSKNRMRLARDQVAFLKERSRVKENIVSHHHGMTAHSTDFGLLQSSLRRPLISIKDDMYKLRQDGP